jgi:hypothetical protein
MAKANQSAHRLMIDGACARLKYADTIAINSGVRKVCFRNAYPNPTLGSWTQKLALRRVATQWKKGGGDHELDPVGEAEWA